MNIFSYLYSPIKNLLKPNKKEIDESEDCSFVQRSYFVIWDSAEDYKTNISRHSSKKDVLNHCNEYIIKPKKIIYGIPLSMLEMGKVNLEKDDIIYLHWNDSHINHNLATCCRSKIGATNYCNYILAVHNILPNLIIHGRNLEFTTKPIFDFKRKDLKMNESIDEKLRILEYRKDFEIRNNNHLDKYLNLKIKYDNGYDDALEEKRILFNIDTNKKFIDYLEDEKRKLMDEKENDLSRTETRRLENLQTILQNMNRQLYVITRKEGFEDEIPYIFTNRKDMEEFCNDKNKEGVEIVKIIFGKHSNDIDILKLDKFGKATNDIYYILWKRCYLFMNNEFYCKLRLNKYLEGQLTCNNISPTVLIYGIDLKFNFVDKIEIDF